MHINPADESAYIVSTQQYDWKGRPTISTHQDGTTRSVSYAGCGCAGQDEVTSTDEMGRKQKAYYDVFGRVTRTEILNASNTVYSSRVPLYNVRDQVETITEYAGAPGSGGASQQTLMTYDGFGRLASRKRPQETAPTTYAYYQNDKLYSGTDARGAVGTLSYNNRNLLTEASYSVPSGVAATPDVTFQYNENGQRTLMDDGPGQVSYEYNTLGEMFQEIRTFAALPGQVYPVSYEYNLSGQVKKVLAPFNDEISYSFDKTGRLTQISGNTPAGVRTYLSGIAYRANDATRSVTYNNSYQATYQYNARMQVRQFEIPGLIGGEYQYYADGRLETVRGAVTKLVGGVPQTTTYDRKLDQRHEYDQSGRLKATLNSYEAGMVSSNETDVNSEPGTSQTVARLLSSHYDYDEFDNLNYRQGFVWYNSGGTFTATYVNNRMTNVTDRNQNQVWEYDEMGEVKKITQGSSTLQESVYDAVGRLLPQGDGYDGNGDLTVIKSGGLNKYKVRSTVLANAELTSLGNSGNYEQTLVYAKGAFICNARDAFIQEMRDPQNTMAAEVFDVNGQKLLRRRLAITPQGEAIESKTSIGQQCYLYPNIPGCNGQSFPPSSGYGPQLNGGRLDLWNGGDGSIVRRVQVDGIWMSEDMAMGLQRHLSGQYSVTGTLGVASLGGIGGSPLGTARNFEMVQKSRQRGTKTEMWIADPEKPGGGYLDVVMDVSDETYYELVETLAPGGSPAKDVPQSEWVSIKNDAVETADKLMDNEDCEKLIRNLRGAKGSAKALLSELYQTPSGPSGENRGLNYTHNWRTDEQTERNDKTTFAVTNVNSKTGRPYILLFRAFFDLATPKADEGYILTDSKGKYVELTARQWRILNILHELSHATDKWSDPTHPDDDPRIKTHGRQFIDTKVLNSLIYRACFENSKIDTRFYKK